MKGKRSKSLSPEPSSSRDAKIPKLSETATINGETAENVAHLLTLSDDVLLNIMKFLTPQDLLALSLCCHRLNPVCHDRTLWRTVDLRSRPTQMKDLGQFLNLATPQTTSIAINGKLRECQYHSPSFEDLLMIELKLDALSRISKKCPNLKELIVEEYCINSQNIKITDFPPTLEKLSLNGTIVDYLTTTKSYFFKMDVYMPNLTTLIISNCRWFTGHSLLVISKMPKLKELRMDSCNNLGDCVAYASLATRFGFKSLEILDLRRTGFGDSEIRSFSSTKTLTHLYLEYPPEITFRNSTVSLDVMDRRHNLFEGPQYEDHVVAQYALGENPFIWTDRSSPRISDISICSLGSYVCDRRVLDDSAMNVILIEEEVRVYNNPNLKFLVVRNYPLVTNKSLVHLAANANKLEYLDVTGTSVTKTGVETFKSQKPNVKIVSSFDET